VERGKEGWLVPGPERSAQQQVKLGMAGGHARLDKAYFGGREEENKT
jgi:hypothetical protein